MRRTTILHQPLPPLPRAGALAAFAACVLSCSVVIGAVFGGANLLLAHRASVLERAATLATDVRP